jgi:hypothetical protein
MEEEFWKAVQAGLDKGWRKGQAMFNALYALEPDLANIIRGQYGVDPFYRDDFIPAFYEAAFGHSVPEGRI